MTDRFIEDADGRPVELLDKSECAKVWEAYDAGQDLSTLLPQRLEGGIEIGEVNAVCSSCLLPCTTVRGSVQQPYPWALEAKGIGYCASCKFLTPIHARFQHRKGMEPSLSLLEGQSWISVPFGEIQETFWRKLLGFPRELRRTFRRWLRQR